MNVEILDHLEKRHIFSNQVAAPRVGDTLSIDFSGPFLVVTDVSWVYSTVEWAGIGVPPTRAVVRTKLKYSAKIRRFF